MTNTSKDTAWIEDACDLFDREAQDLGFPSHVYSTRLRALRAELDEAKAEIERLRADRPFIIGFVEGFDAAVKECEALVREKFEKCRKVSMTYTGLDAASDISDLKGTSDD